MATTSFGVMYDKQPLKVTGFYKYTPGAEFYNAMVNCRLVLLINAL